MARRNETILNLLVGFPWWVSLLVSGVAFISLRFILSSIDFGSTAANSFAKGLSGGVSIVALVLLLPAPIVALNSLLKKRRRNSQKGSKKIPSERTSKNVCPKCGGENGSPDRPKGSKPRPEIFGLLQFS